MHRGKITIDVEVKDSIAEDIYVHAMDVQGDSIGLTAAIIAGAFGAFDPKRNLELQLKDRILMQKAIATALLNGTVKLMGNSININTANALSMVLKTVTDVNINTLTEIVKTSNNLKNPKDDKQTERRNEQGRSGISSFDDFS